MSSVKKKILPIAKWLSSCSRKLAFFFHRLQFRIEWGSEHTPEWFDHFYDQYYLWRDCREAFWLERGIYSLMALKPGGQILELCCGDGFNTYHFYSARAAKITAVDFDPVAIRHACRYNSFNNIEFLVRDIRTGIPDGCYDNIVWDAAIQHFTEAEIENIMQTIKQRLTTDGILSGYTIVEKEDGTKSFSYHEREFRSMEDLHHFFAPYFANILIFETSYKSRRNLYFFASDGVIPFTPQSPNMYLKTKA